MSDYYFGKVRARNNAAAVDSDGGGVTATQAAPTGNHKLVCAGIQCSGDKAALVTVESPSGTVLWRKRFGAAFTHSESFATGTIAGPAAAAMVVKISDSTTNSEANLQTFEIVG